jgi:hypothetical protein
MSLLFNQYRRDEPFVISSMTMEDGLNVGEAKKICATTFKNEIAHLTLEIASPRVLEVIHDERVTFPDMLGTIGNDQILTIYCITVKWGFIDSKLAWVHKCIFDSQRVRGGLGRIPRAIIIAQVHPRQWSVNETLLAMWLTFSIRK